MSSKTCIYNYNQEFTTSANSPNELKVILEKEATRDDISLNCDVASREAQVYEPMNRTIPETRCETLASKHSFSKSLKTF